MAGITTFLDESKMPTRTQEQKLFDNLMAAVFQNFPKWGREVNETLGALNALAAGGAYAIPYVFDTATADADPGAGKLRLSAASQNASTLMRLDLTAGGQDYTTLLDTFDASTSFIKGTIRLAKQGDLNKWMTFDVTARTAAAGYRNLTVICTDSSSTSPFVKDDPLMLFFQRNGDRGPIGGRDVVLAEYKVTTAVAAIDFPNIITDEYDDFSIEYRGLVGGSTVGASYPISLWLFANGVLQTAGYGPLGSGTTVFVNPNWSLGDVRYLQPVSGFRGADGQARICGARRTNNPLRSVFLSQTRVMNTSGNNGQVSDNLIGAASISNPISGARISISSGSFTEGAVRIVGHRSN